MSKPQRGDLLNLLKTASSVSSAVALHSIAKDIAETNEREKRRIRNEQIDQHNQRCARVPKTNEELEWEQDFRRQVQEGADKLRASKALLREASKAKQPNVTLTNGALSPRTSVEAKGKALPDLFYWLGIPTSFVFSVFLVHRFSNISFPAAYPLYFCGSFLQIALLQFIALRLRR